MAKTQKPSRHEEAVDDCLEALQIEKRGKNIIAQMNVLNSLGNIYKVQGKYDEAVQYYVKSLKIGESLYPESQEIGDTYNSLGCVFSARETIL